MSALFQIVDQPIDVATLKAGLTRESAGACVCFEGWVRDNNDGQSVLALDYEAHAPLAEREGGRILEEAIERFGLEAARCQHRVGALALGDCAVWVGVSSGHRGESFQACRYIIDEVKARVPIWKKEHYASGKSGWVNCATGAAKGQ